MVDFTHSLKEHTYKKPQGLEALVVKTIKSRLRSGMNKRLNADITGADILKDREGKKTIIVANHVGFEDALMIGLNAPIDMAYAIDTAQYNMLMQIPPASLRNVLSAEWRKKWFAKTAAQYVQLVPIDPANPFSMRKLTKIVEDGTPLAIFPEGALTKSGTLGKVYEGTAKIAATTGADVFPVNLRGFEFLNSTSQLLKGYPKHDASDVALTFFPPFNVKPAPKGTRAKDARVFVNEQMKSVMHAMRVEGRDKSLTIGDAFTQAVHNFGPDRTMVESFKLVGGVYYPESSTYDDILLKSLVLGNHLKKYTKKREHVGFMLPNGLAGTVGLLGLHMAGRVPTMLNPTHSPQQLAACCKTADVQTIITSRLYVEKGKLQARMDELSKTCRIIYLEDEKDKISLTAKLGGKLRSLIHRRPAKNNRGLVGAIAKGTPRAIGRLLEATAFKLKADEPAIILFSTGSEGDPKAIVHSSQTLLSNIEQVRSVSPFTPEEIVFNPMPIFHSFGLTGGLLMPLTQGLKSVQYPSPLDNKGIPEAFYHSTATALMGTPTFLSNWSRYADRITFANLRHVISGGERLSPEKAREFFEKYGVEIDSCYGATETGPVISMNTRANRKTGSVGKILPGVEPRLDPVPGVEEGGRLFVKGPNVMLGVMKSDKPGVIQPPEDGWHDTGDIVTIDSEGYIAIKGRAKRFAKIGGEMVSLDLIEGFAAAASKARPDFNPNRQPQHFALTLRDPQKGEKIVMLTTDANLSAEQIKAAAKAESYEGLGIPKTADVVRVPGMPAIGIKINGQLLQKIFEGRATDKDLLDGGLNPQQWDGIGGYKPEVANG